MNKVVVNPIFIVLDTLAEPHQRGDIGHLVLPTICPIPAAKPPGQIAAAN